jgi:hypothetical protein
VGKNHKHKMNKGKVDVDHIGNVEYEISNSENNVLSKEKTELLTEDKVSFSLF